jgi:BirA family transcriptional regulator, biotin operon repressor / biotin---[acetyl-CoA-carboxylase] ligase
LYLDVLKNKEFEKLKSLYLEHLFRFNVIQEFEKQENRFNAQIVDINNAGLLVLKTKNGIEEFNFKEVKYVF